MLKSKIPYLEDAVDELEQQVKVSKLLGMAFVLSITGLFGVGSLIALVLGWKARRLIQASGGRISGHVMAWWCILAGGLGTLIVLVAATTLIIGAILNR